MSADCVLRGVEGNAQDCFAVLPLPLLKCSVLGRECRKDSGMGAGEEHVVGTERLSSVLCCTSLSHCHRSQILLPTEEKL